MPAGSESPSDEGLEPRPEEVSRPGAAKGAPPLLKGASAYLAQSSPRAILGLAMFLLLVIGVVDYFTSIEVSLLTFYWLPVALATWYCGARSGYWMAALSVAIALGMDIAGGLVRSHSLYLAWDFLTRLASFVVFVWVLAKLKQLYVRALKTSRLEVELRASQAAFLELKKFGYLIAHNWRAPLRSIDGYSQLLLQDYADQLGPTGREYVRHLGQSSHVMADLIDSLLQLIEFSGGALKREPVDLSALAESIGARLQAAEPAHPVQFAVQPGVVARADRHLLTVALEELMSNAWKFTRGQPRATVAFGAMLAAGGALYFVRDNGAGFDMAHAHMLFKPHQSAHKPDEFPGIGIGLSIVERIIRRHGGRIWAESAPGQGATFYFTLENEPEAR